MIQFKEKKTFFEHSIFRNRSHSPKGKNTPKMTRDDSSKPAYDLNYHAKLFKHAITHFKDVVNKNKLEMLHGNGTIVLESIGAFKL